MRFLLAILVVGLMTTGCATECPSVATVPAPEPERAFIVAVSIHIPGASAETVDKLIGSEFLRNAVTIRGVRRVLGVASDGVFEGYVEATATDGAEAKVRTKAALPEGGLPAGAEETVVRLVEEIPHVTPASIPVVDIALDRTKLAALGLSVAEVAEVIPKPLSGVPASKDPATDLGLLIVTTRNGRPVYLSDVATFTARKRASCIVRRHPPEPLQSNPSSMESTGDEGLAQLERMAPDIGSARMSQEDLEKLQDMVPPRSDGARTVIIIDDSMSTSLKDTATQPTDQTRLEKVKDKPQSLSDGTPSTQPATQP